VPVLTRPVGGNLVVAMERASLQVDLRAQEALRFHRSGPGEWSGPCESDSIQGLAPGKSVDGASGQPLGRSSFQAEAHVSFRVEERIKLSILMSAYNEERTILKAINEILQVSYPCEIELIVVDDGSTDNTSSLLSEIRDARVTVHRHLRNQGKGAGILSAASLATGTHMLPFDADLEYAPEDIVKLLDPVIKGRYDVVFGVRLFGCNTVYQSYRYAVGNKLLTRITNVLYDSYLNDLHTCLKLMPLAMLKSMSLSETGFGLDTQVTALLLRRGIRPFEVPVSYYSRSHKQGKKITWRDAVKCVWILLKTRIGFGAQNKCPDALNQGGSQNAGAGTLSSEIARTIPRMDHRNTEISAASLVAGRVAERQLDCG
jgi:dolichol-phosphate hexosyltransferase